jgi:hypothetical protein
MRVLFVCSGNNKNFEIAPFIINQANYRTVNDSFDSI